MYIGLGTNVVNRVYDLVCGLGGKHTQCMFSFCFYVILDAHAVTLGAYRLFVL